MSTYTITLKPFVVDANDKKEAIRVLANLLWFDPEEYLDTAIITEAVEEAA